MMALEVLSGLITAPLYIHEKYNTNMHTGQNKRYKLGYTFFEIIIVPET